MPGRSELARIHIALKELGLDDATYRGILRKRFKTGSAANLTNRQAAQLLELFRQKGWRPSSFAQRGLIHRLWRRLAAAKAVTPGDDRALAAFIEHATGKDELPRLTVAEASRVIEQLKKWLERVEVTASRH